MKTKNDNYGSGRKLPWHFGAEDEFHPVLVWLMPKNLNQINPL